MANWNCEVKWFDYLQLVQLFLNIDKTHHQAALSLSENSSSVREEANRREQEALRWNLFLFYFYDFKGL